MARDGCCDCNHGGKATAINIKYVEEWESKLLEKCKDVVCVAAISDDPSCFSIPKCVNNECKLVEAY